MEDKKLDILDDKLASIEKKKKQLDQNAIKNYVKFSDVSQELLPVKKTIKKSLDYSLFADSEYDKKIKNFNNKTKQIIAQSKNRN